MSSCSPPSQRLAQIDLLRGLVMLLMLLDHVRETFYLHLQLSDPVDVQQVSPLLFVLRLLAHLCAPVFVFLTGLAAWLYGQRQSDPRTATAAFLFKRGLFLVALELTVVNFAWTFVFPPDTVYLQVIWAIGVSMLALSALLWLPRPLLAAIGLLVIAGHNLFDGVAPVDGPWAAVWAVLHQRAWLEPFEGLRLRTSYPVLPWMGVIALGYVAGPWFARDADPAKRRRLLGIWGLGALTAFAVLRLVNGYGDTPWRADVDVVRTVISVFNVTKYPPSLLFLCLTLGTGWLLLRAFERPALAARLAPLAVFGAAPMFFYLLHLYVLKLLYVGAEAVWGRNQGPVFGFGHAGWLLPMAAVLAVGLYPAVRWFAALKARRRDLAWLRYL